MQSNKEKGANPNENPNKIPRRIKNPTQPNMELPKRHARLRKRKGIRTPSNRRKQHIPSTPINTKPEIAFIVANPYTLVEDYSFNIDEPTINLLEIQNQQDVFVLGVLSLKEPFETSTINLQAPLIFQSNTKKAKQMILNDNTFSMRHPIGNQVTATEGKA